MPWFRHLHVKEEVKLGLSLINLPCQSFCPKDAFVELGARFDNSKTC